METSRPHAPRSKTEKWSRGRVVYDATGKGDISLPAVQELAELICSDPKPAGRRIWQDVEAGATQAQSAAYALFKAARCQSATDRAYAYAVEAVSSGDPAERSDVQDWFSNLVEAANFVGIPMCVVLAVYDPDAQQVLRTQELHTGTSL